MAQNPLRNLPSVTEVLSAASLRDAATRHAHDRIVEAIRAELADVRQQIGQGTLDGWADGEAIAARAAER